MSKQIDNIHSTNLKDRGFNVVTNGEKLVWEYQKN